MIRLSPSSLLLPPTASQYGTFDMARSDNTANFDRSSGYIFESLAIMQSTTLSHVLT